MLKIILIYLTMGQKESRKWFMHDQSLREFCTASTYIQRERKPINLKFTIAENLTSIQVMTHSLLDGVLEHELFLGHMT